MFGCWGIPQFWRPWSPMKPHAGGLLGVRPEAREHSVRLVACLMHDAIALKRRAGDALDHKLQCIFKASPLSRFTHFFWGGRVQGRCSFEATSGLQASCPALATTTWLPSMKVVARSSAVNRGWVEPANHPALDCLADMSQINPEKSTPLRRVWRPTLQQAFGSANSFGNVGHVHLWALSTWA